MQEARHPNIVQYIGLCLAPPAPPSYSTFDSMDSFDDSSLANSRSSGRQRILIISEFLPGGNLRSYIAGKEETHPFPWRLRLSYSIDIARALAYMHARKCMHRDLKGENMLITENQRIKVRKRRWTSDQRRSVTLASPGSPPATPRSSSV